MRDHASPGSFQSEAQQPGEYICPQDPDSPYSDDIYGKWESGVSRALQYAFQDIRYPEKRLRTGDHAQDRAAKRYDCHVLAEQSYHGRGKNKKKENLF